MKWLHETVAKRVARVVSERNLWLQKGIYFCSCFRLSCNFGENGIALRREGIQSIWDFSSLSFSFSLSSSSSSFLSLPPSREEEWKREGKRGERNCELRSITRATIQDCLPSLHTIHIRALNFQTCNGHKRNLCQNFSLTPSFCLFLTISLFH